MGIRSAIRKATIDGKVEYKTKTFAYEGEEVVFKQPSQKVRQEIISKSVNDKDRIDPVLFNVYSVIYLTYDSEGEKVFSEADVDGFLNYPAGGFIDKFAEEATKLMGNMEPVDSQEG